MELWLEITGFKVFVQTLCSSDGRVMATHWEALIMEESNRCLLKQWALFLHYQILMETFGRWSGIVVIGITGSRVLQRGNAASMDE